MADRTPEEIAAEAMRHDLLRDGGDHGCRVPLSEHLNALTISGHVDLTALSRAALSALEREGWVLLPREPTKAMKAATVPAGTPFPMQAFWRAMLAAAPNHGGTGKAP